jgi:putative N6-adenine-specific DNA methylase
MSDRGAGREPILFATAARGTEGAVRDELRDLGFRGVRADRGGVHFGRSVDEGMRACIEMRTAIRVLERVAVFDAPNGDALYDGVRTVDWTRWLSPKHTLAVRAVCRESRLTHSQFVAQRTKDAVVDQLRDALGTRPSVDLADPDVLLFVHVARDQATVYVDMSGASLHKRGWRAQAGAAPLKESLAAAILRLAGWDRRMPLVDPMCGSGTLAIEAAQWARHMAPGLVRERFGFERWACHDEEAVRRTAEHRENARAKVLPASPRIRGSDVDPAALGMARDNARDARVEIEWARASVRDLAPSLMRDGVPDGGPALLVTNPPYGDRLEGGDALYQDMARAFSRLRGWRVAILAGSPAIERAMGRRADRSLVLHNGDIECRLLTFDVV